MDIQDLFSNWPYLAWAFVYCLAYATAGVLLAFILFEDRDLA